MMTASGTRPPSTAASAGEQPTEARPTTSAVAISQIAPQHALQPRGAHRTTETKAARFARWRQQLFQSLRWLGWAILIGAAAGSLLSFAGESSWLLDLTSHFRLQYAGLMAIAFIALLWKRQANWATLALALLVLNVTQLAPFYFEHPRQPLSTTAASVQKPLRVLQMNVFLLNHDHQAVLRYLQDTQPDVVGMEEFVTHWQSAFESSSIRKLYPYQVIVPGSRTALFSRLPISNYRVEQPPGSRYQVIQATVLWNNQPVTLMVSHAAVPLLPHLYQEQRDHFRYLASRLRSLETPAVLLGDLNTTPWSANYQLLVSESQLRDARYGFGLQPSWPSIMPPAAIPIDHVLVSDEVKVLKRSLAPFVGSDHRPVLVELALSSYKERILSRR
ncbi:MAG: endonuclease/exonuclease/phosphatase family protein [Candidatus Melainabacteria bacterium]|nr:endonuclease/exonuclease/phosphatase family protein [Candidatus Melainabacteria bacterium]